MNDYGTFIEPDTIRFERLLPGPIERVWDFLTIPEKRAKWLAGGTMELKVNGVTKLAFNNSSLSEHDDPVPEKYCNLESGSGFTAEVLRCEPPFLLVHTWSDRSEVMYALSPKDNEVLLVLTHSRLSKNKNERISVAAGWHTHLNILKDVLKEIKPPGFWRVHSKLELEYGKLNAINS